MNRILLAALFITLVTINCSSRPADPNPAAGFLPASGSSAPASWVRYYDPSEHSFSIEVPQGWQVQGGMYRFGYFDVRATVDLRSPDGNIIIRFDDANVPAYALPGPYRPREGQPYSKPRQFQMVVKRYESARSFAETYSKSRFRSVCQTLTEQPSAWKPSMPAAFQVANAQTTSDATVDYACASAAGPRLASVYARTSLYSATAFWQADPVLSAVTTPALMPVAQSVLQHAIDSFQIDPQWQRHQQQMTQEGLQVVQQDYEAFLAQTRATMQKFSSSMNQQVSGFEARQNTSAAQSDSWGKILTGITDARDPYTGEQFQVWTGPNSNYYINGLGDKRNANTSPGPGYHQLESN